MLVCVWHVSSLCVEGMCGMYVVCSVCVYVWFVSSLCGCMGCMWNVVCV